MNPSHITSQLSLMILSHNIPACIDLSVNGEGGGKGGTFPYIFKIVLQLVDKPKKSSVEMLWLDLGVI